MDGKGRGYESTFDFVDKLDIYIENRVKLIKLALRNIAAEQSILQGYQK